MLISQVSKTILTASWLLLSITVSGYAQTIEVTGNNIVIWPGSTAVNYLFGTAFGDVSTHDDDEVNNLFIIRNKSTTTNLEISNITLTGSSANQFSRFFLGSTVTPGSDLDLIVSFEPNSLGTKSALVTITTNDPVTPQYTFIVQGNGVDTEPAALRTDVTPGNTHLAVAKKNEKTSEWTLKLKLQLQNLGFGKSLGGTVYVYTGTGPLNLGDSFLGTYRYRKIRARKDDKVGSRVAKGKLTGLTQNLTNVTHLQLYFQDSQALEAQFTNNWLVIPLTKD